MNKLGLLFLLAGYLTAAQTDCTDYDDCYDKGYYAKKWIEKIAFYSQAIEKWNGDEHSDIFLADAYSGRGEAYMHEAYYDKPDLVSKALEDASSALNTNKKDWRAHYIRGYVAVIKEHGWDSINYHFEKAVACDTEIAFSPYFLASKYYNWKYYSKAKEFVDIAINRLPERSFSKDEKKRSKRIPKKVLNLRRA